MDFVCGWAVPASISSEIEIKRGSIRLTIPFSINGRRDSVSALSITGNRKIKVPMSLSNSVFIPSSFTSTIRGEKEIALALSGMNEPSSTLKIRTSSSISGEFEVYSTLSETLRNSIEVRQMIGDCSKRGILKISKPMGRANIRDSLKVSLPESSAEIIKDELNLFADGIKMTERLISAEIHLFGGGRTSEANVTLKGYVRCDKISININGFSYDFRTSNISAGDRQTKIKGKPEIASKQISLNIRNRSGLQLASDMDNVIWSAGRFMAKRINCNTSLGDFASRLAESCCGQVKTLNDELAICSPYGEKQNITTDFIISFTENIRRDSENIEISYGENGDSHITIEPEKRSVTTPEAFINVYSSSSFDIYSPDGELEEVSSDIVTVSELVTFENGEGKLSKPASKVLTAGIGCNGKITKSTRDISSTNIVYQTIRTRYKISSDSIGRKTIYATTDSSLTIINDPTKPIKTIEDNIITDYVSAFRRAKNELKSDIVTIETLHQQGLNSPFHNTITTPIVSGDVISASVKIENNPVKITNILEVRPWQK